MTYNKRGADSDNKPIVVSPKTISKTLYSRMLDLEKIGKRQQLRSILETQETSMQNIVHELQNSVNQTLVASKFFLEEAAEGGDNRMLVSKSHGLTNDAIDALTMLCITMHPTVVTDVGLIDGIGEYIVELRKISAVQIQFECSDTSIEEIDEKDKISIFRIIQNYLSLVLQNPATSMVNIEMSYKTALLTLLLSQNEPRFNFMKAGQAFNLSDISNRITYFNGTIRQKQEGKIETAVVELSLS